MRDPRRARRGRAECSPRRATRQAPPERGKGDRLVEAVIAHAPTELDEETLERRRGRERKGRAVGRYSMCVHVTSGATQIAVLEGRSLIEHYVSRPSDDVSQIHGNIYLARVQTVLPGMEAAFVDIGTPKNAVLYRGDVQYDPEDIERSAKGRPRIEDVLRAGQTIVCQVTKNPIGAKGARLTQEVSLPGRFVVLIPNSSTYGISKRLPGLGDAAAHSRTTTKNTLGSPGYMSPEQIREELRERRDQLQALVGRVAELGIPALSPWRGVGLQALLPSERGATPA